MNPNIMACSRGIYGKCTRCGVAHPRSRAWSDLNTEFDEVRAKAIQEAQRKKAAREAKKLEWSHRDVGGHGRTLL